VILTILKWERHDEWTWGDSSIFDIFSRLWWDLEYSSLTSTWGETTSEFEFCQVLCSGNHNTTQPMNTHFTRSASKTIPSLNVIQYWHSCPTHRPIATLQRQVHTIPVMNSPSTYFKGPFREITEPFTGSSISTNITPCKIPESITHGSHPEAEQDACSDTNWNSGVVRIQMFYSKSWHLI
jgi:hypothetical protein